MPTFTVTISEETVYRVPVEADTAEQAEAAAAEKLRSTLHPALMFAGKLKDRRVEQIETEAAPLPSLDNIPISELPIVAAIVDDALAAGYEVSVRYDGPAFAPDDSAIERETHREAILAEVAATDETWLVFYRTGDERRTGWVRLVHGNGCDVLSDWSDNGAVNAIVARASQLADQAR